MHAKTLVVDDDVAFTGSANYTYRGLLSNLEQVALVTFEPAVKQLLEGEEDLDWGFHSEPNA